MLAALQHKPNIMNEQQKQQPDHCALPIKNTGNAKPEQKKPTEVGGVDGPEPTRYGDWEHNGRCTDF